MENKRHKPEEIVQKLRQVDVLVGQGMQRVDAIREVPHADCYPCLAHLGHVVSMPCGFGADCAETSISAP